MSTMWRTTAASVLLALTLPALAAPATAAAGSERRQPATSEDREQRQGPDRKQRTPAPGETIKATVVKTGWWWVANEPPPETGVLASPVAPTPTTPKGSVPVGAAAGEPERISAIEVRLKAEPGSAVNSFEMVLRETSAPGANANAEQATIVACPVTEAFWADGAAAAWKSRPAYDCSLAEAEGKRTAKGLWRFDLTSFAATWLAEGNVDSRSVVLVEKVEAPEGFQVAFDGPKAEGVGLELKAQPPTDVPGETGGLPTGGVGGSSSAGGFSGGSASPVDSGLGAVGGGAGLGGSPITSEPVSGQPAAATSEEPRAAARLQATPVAAVAPWYSGMPKAAYLLLPLTLALAYLIMLALGPAARPVPVTGRRGVSRALDRLRETGRDLRTTR